MHSVDSSRALHEWPNANTNPTLIGDRLYVAKGWTREDDHRRRSDLVELARNIG
jgi:hypothetical protein